MKAVIVGALAIVVAAQSPAWSWHWPHLRKRKDKPAAAQTRAARPRALSGPAWSGPAALAALLVQAESARSMQEQTTRAGSAQPAVSAVAVRR